MNGKKERKGRGRGGRVLPLIVNDKPVGMCSWEYEKKNRMTTTPSLKEAY
jgi:hypothetical protein